MLTVVAPAAMAVSTTCARNSISVREASSGENSTSSHSSRARATPVAASLRISSCAMLSLYWRWMALVARNTWMRRCAASFTACATRSMSSGLQRARPQMIGPCTSRATASTLSKSPREAAGKPASMTSTPSSASARATRSFSGRVMLQPGDCSPSRSVVSKISTRSGLATIRHFHRFSSGWGRARRHTRRAPYRSGTLLLQPRHARAQRRAGLLDRVRQVLLQELLVVHLAGGVFLDPLAGELAALHFLQHLAHLVLDALIHDARTAREVAVFGGLADELVHLGDAALVEQVDDQHQLVQALVVGDFGLVAGFHQGLEALHHKLGRPAAQHRLLAEQVGLGLLRERRLDHPAARAADAVGVGERPGVRLAGSVLRDREQTRDARALLVLAAHEVAGPLGRDQHHVEVLARLDLLEVHVEAVREQQRRALLEVGLDALVELLLRGVRDQDRHEIRALHGILGLLDLQSRLLRLLPSRAALAHADDDVEA